MNLPEGPPTLFTECLLNEMYFLFHFTTQEPLLLVDLRIDTMIKEPELGFPGLQNTGGSKARFEDNFSTLCGSRISIELLRL